MGEQLPISEVNDVRDWREFNQHYFMHNPSDFVNTIEAAGEKLNDKSESLKNKRKSFEDFLHHLIDFNPDYVENVGEIDASGQALYVRSDILSAFEDTVVESYNVSKDHSEKLFQKVFGNWYQEVNNGEIKGLYKNEMAAFGVQTWKNILQPMFKQEMEADLAATRAFEAVGWAENAVEQLEMPRRTVYPTMQTPELNEYVQNTSEIAKNLESYIHEKQEQTNTTDVSTYDDVMNVDDYPVLSGLLDVYSMAFIEYQHVSEFLNKLDALED